MTPNELVEILRKDVITGAHALLGAVIETDGMLVQITETEAYRSDDPGCHSFGKSKMSNMAMFGEPGTAYIYRSYGCHWMLNVVSHDHGDACAVLIRSGKPLQGIEQMRENRGLGFKDHELLSGPGKLTQALGIDSTLNGKPVILNAAELIIHPAKDSIVPKISPRIGISIGKGHETLWRFTDPDEMRYVTPSKFNRHSCEP